jgi:hypothetical protein
MARVQRGLAIRVPEGSSAVARVRRTGYLPLHGRPRQLAIPGAAVVMVQEGGKPVVVARAKRLQGPTSVTLIDGQKRDGYKLWLTKIGPPATRKPLGIKWYAIGQFRYFDPRRWAPTLVGPLEPRRGEYLENVPSSAPRFTIRRGAFTGSVQGKPKSHPESALVRRFVAWLNCESAIEQHRLLPDRFLTDLFDTSKWRLIEAKISCDRQTLRAALGQLYDYRLFYRRRPSLGVLLGARPTKRCLAFLRDHRVTTVWETASGAFRDSADGAWSRLRRIR